VKALWAVRALVGYDLNHTKPVLFRLDFYYQGRVLAITHLVTLGWITTTIMGASFLVSPLILSVPLYSERLGRR
jgi:hypothetical protein